jgi:hypothetical protein
VFLVARSADGREPVANVNALCAQATKLTSQVNLLGSALEGTARGGVIPLGVKLVIPGLPASLPGFGCT